MGVPSSPCCPDPSPPRNEAQPRVGWVHPWPRWATMLSLSFPVCNHLGGVRPRLCRGGGQRPGKAEVSPGGQGPARAAQRWPWSPLGPTTPGHCPGLLTPSLPLADPFFHSTPAPSQPKVLTHVTLHPRVNPGRLRGVSPERRWHPYTRALFRCACGPAPCWAPGPGPVETDNRSVRPPPRGHKGRGRGEGSGKAFPKRWPHGLGFCPAPNLSPGSLLAPRVRHTPGGW